MTDPEGQARSEGTLVGAAIALIGMGYTRENLDDLLDQAEDEAEAGE